MNENTVSTMIPLPDGFSARAFTLDDLEELVAVANAYWEPLLGMRKFSSDDLRRAFSMPGFDLAASSHVVVAPDGRLVAFSLVTDVADPPVHPEALGCVDAAFERRGIGTHLLAWAEARARQAIARVPEDVRVAMHVPAASTHAPTARLLARHGFTAIRSSYLMVIDLAEPPPAPQWPEGLVLRTYQDRPDVRAVYRAVNDSFQDHWGYVKRDEDKAVERWQYRFEHDPDFDPTLWYLLMDGEEIAAIALCEPLVGDDRSIGFVSTLGVRRAWRRRGLALMLLQHIFGEFHRRGYKQVGLGVDAQSLTGATRLYEKAGMRVMRELTTYEKELRAGRELSIETLPGAAG